MAEEKESPDQPIKPRTSKLAVTVFVLSVLIVVGWLGFWGLSKLNLYAHNMWCWEHFKNLELALILYSHDNKDPLPENWCDIVHTQEDISLKTLNCVESDTIEGESAYAMNENAVGRKLSELPKDMVFLFESDKGKEQTRSLPFTKRVFVKSINKQLPDEYKDSYVYPLRWNQAGGPGDAAFRHFVGKEKCCHVLFVNGSIELVSKKDIPKLRWTAE